MMVTLTLTGHDKLSIYPSFKKSDKSVPKYLSDTFKVFFRLLWLTFHQINLKNSEN